VVPVVVPSTLTFDILACCDNSRSSHHGNQIALTTNLDSQDTKSALITVESDSLDRALQAVNGCIRMRPVPGIAYHLRQSGSVFCEAAFFVLFTAAIRTGIIAPHLLACTKKLSMQTCTVSPAKSAQQVII